MAGGRLANLCASSATDRVSMPDDRGTNTNEPDALGSDSMAQLHAVDKFICISVPPKGFMGFMVKAIFFFPPRAESKRLVVPVLEGFSCEYISKGGIYFAAFLLTLLSLIPYIVHHDPLQCPRSYLDHFILHLLSPRADFGDSTFRGEIKDQGSGGIRRLVGRSRAANLFRLLRNCVMGCVLHFGCIDDTSRKSSQSGLGVENGGGYDLTTLPLPIIAIALKVRSRNLFSPSIQAYSLNNLSRPTLVQSSPQQSSRWQSSACSYCTADSSSRIRDSASPSIRSVPCVSHGGSRRLWEPL